MKRAILILSIVFLLVSNSFAQAFHFTSVISITNSPIGFVLTPVNEYVGTFSFLTIIPKLTIRQQIFTPLGEVPVKFWDWSFRNFSAGFKTYFTVSHFTLSTTLSYEKQGWKAYLLRNRTYVNFKRQSFSPEVCLTFYAGNSDVIFLWETGVRRNFTFAGDGEYRDRKCYNDGVTGIYGVGVSFSYIINFTIRYEHDYFDYFNQDFTAPNGTKPYQDFTTKHGLLSFNFEMPLGWN